MLLKLDVVKFDNVKVQKMWFFQNNAFLVFKRRNQNCSCFSITISNRLRMRFVLLDLLNEI